jgi:hypothetical protein
MLPMTCEYTCPSLVISQYTSDGLLDLPVAGVSITNDRLGYMTVTGIHHILVTLGCGWPVTSMLHQGYSTVLYISLKYK